MLVRRRDLLSKEGNICEANHECGGEAVYVETIRYVCLLNVFLVIGFLEMVPNREDSI